MEKLHSRTVTVGTICSGCDAIAVVMNSIAEAFQNLMGLDLHFEWVFACEISKPCQRMIVDLHGKLWTGPIFADAMELASEDGLAYCIRAKRRISVPAAMVILAGTWCGGFSNLNRERTARSSQIPRAILNYCAKFLVLALLLENVPQMASEGKDEDAGEYTEGELTSGLAEARSALDEIHMDSAYFINCCSEFGDPQHRRRMYLAAVRRSIGGVNWREHERILNMLKRKARRLDTYIRPFDVLKHNIFMQSDKLTCNRRPRAAIQENKKAERIYGNATPAMDFPPAIWQVPPGQPSYLGYATQDPQAWHLPSTYNFNIIGIPERHSYLLFYYLSKFTQVETLPKDICIIGTERSWKFIQGVGIWLGKTLCPAIVPASENVIVHAAGKQVRWLHPYECWDLQGFPIYEHLSGAALEMYSVREMIRMPGQSFNFIHCAAHLLAMLCSSERF